MAALDLIWAVEGVVRAGRQDLKALLVLQGRRDREVGAILAGGGTVKRIADLS